MRKMGMDFGQNLRIPEPKKKIEILKNSKFRENRFRKNKVSENKFWKNSKPFFIKKTPISLHFTTISLFLLPPKIKKKFKTYFSSFQPKSVYYLHPPLSKVPLIQVQQPPPNHSILIHRGLYTKLQQFQRQ